VRNGARTLGQRVENLAAPSPQRHRSVVLMWLSWALTPYAWHVARTRWLDRARAAAAAALHIERAVAVAALLNALAFLWSGHYATLYARLWRVRLRAARRGALRNVAAMGLWHGSRELVWQAATELLLTLAPLVDLRRLAASVARRLATSSSASTPADSDHDDARRRIGVGASSSASERCMFCNELVLQRAALTCCRDAMACYWCACAERRIGGLCLRCKKSV